MNTDLRFMVSVVAKTWNRMDRIIISDEDIGFLDQMLASSPMPTSDIKQEPSPIPSFSEVG